MADNNEGMRFPPQPTKSKIFCCVYNCNSKACRDTTVRFHHFPKPGECLVELKNNFGNIEKIDRRKAWEIVLKHGKPVTDSMRVCSLHFTEKDYTVPSYVAKKRYLRGSCIPSCNLPKSTAGYQKNVELEEIPERRCRQRSWRKKQNEMEQLQKQCEEEATVGQGNTMELDEKEDDCIDEEATVGSSQTTPPPSLTFADIGVQVTSGDIFQKFVGIIKTDDELSTFTGIPTLKLLAGIEEAVKIFKPDSASAKLSIREVIIMTFMKLKQNLSYAVLSALFKCCTPENCSSRVHEMLTILNNILKCAIPWPTKDQISRNIPKCFENFEVVRIVIDCTEIAIQRPKKLCCQIKTYSHYKGGNTVKVMTGVTPGGLISFVSKPYGGRCSDKAIFEQSGLINLLERNDAIMVDKGFLVDEICKENDIKLLRPPFLKDKRQFSDTEALLTASIARARVHIERSNQRLKTFKVLGGKMPGDLLCKVEEMFTIISAVVNLGPPILKDDKFM